MNYLNESITKQLPFQKNVGNLDDNLRRELSFYIQMVIVVAFSLVVIGLTFILSSTYSISIQRYGNPFSLFLRQLLWVGVGILLMLVFSRIDTSLYSKFVKVILLVGIVVSLLPFVPGVGKARGDAYRWINLGILNISSSEIVKMVLIIYISVILSRKMDKKNFFSVFLPIFIVAVFFFGVISLQMDVSMAFLILLSSLVVMYVGGVPLIQIILTFVVSLSFTFLVGDRLPYLHNRIIAFLDPWSDPFGKGYHYISMLRSFQNGIFGVGIGNGVIKDKYLPEAHTDSIFSVIAEETGIIGTLLVIVLIVMLFYYSIRLAVRINDTYRSSLVVGFASIISIWGLVNILVNIGLLPPTGTNLPLVSYGGANIITSFIALGIIYRCYKEKIKGIV
ncbi:MAG: putative peptidoglycan glycosyltransferase FtsW [Spirochaetia bacterium]|nr:putative lipid II flippase FtsW [Spirochaetota bacterium]MCX8097018.1 putative lipid II flippase FtsW [Spirochaetota bacterium]MDW8111899.1 putative peptidoglycan glycosyltransferase FtsW [Spirochaetia bacterium]